MELAAGLCLKVGPPFVAGNSIRLVRPSNQISIRSPLDLRHGGAWHRLDRGSTLGRQRQYTSVED